MKRGVFTQPGSVASHPDVRDGPGRSAMPPIATASVRRNEALRCAKRRHLTLCFETKEVAN